MVMTRKRVLSMLLAALMMVSVFTVIFVNGYTNASAAAGESVYLEAPASWTTAYCYMWNGTGAEKNADWPGVKMDKVEGNIYSYTLNGSYENVIFNAGNGGAQTDDLKYPGAGKIYNLSNNTWADYAASDEPSISCSAQDGASFYDDTMSVTLTLKNAQSGTYSLDGGKAVSFTGSADVIVGQGKKGNTDITLAVTATDGTNDIAKTFTFHKKYKAPSTGSSGDDNHTTDAIGGKYATNPDGQVGGKDVTIASAADWKNSMIIAQGVANDDANVFKGPHEYPNYDSYALYAAWDNNKLYLGWQFVNVRDVVSPEQQGAGTNEAKPYNADMPQMIALDLGKGNYADGSMVAGQDPYVWNKQIGYTTNVDAVMAFSSKPGVGTPALFTTNSDGKFSYDQPYCNNFTSLGISFKYEDGFFGEEMTGINGDGYKGYTPDMVFSDSSKWTDFTSTSHKTTLDTMYTMSIPFEALGITKADLESNGIGVMHLSVYGKSAVNSLPMDPSMLDNATEEADDDPSTTGEKTDTDNITVPLARVGAIPTGGGETPKEVAVDFGADKSSPQQASQAITLSADAYNGTAPYTYEFKVNGSVIKTGSENSVVWTPAQAGTYELSVKATDSTGLSKTVTKTYVIEGSSVTPPPTGFELGDANGDGKFDLNDVLTVQKYLASMIPLTGDYYTAADVDKSGTVDISDVLRMQKKLAGMIADF